MFDVPVVLVDARGGHLGAPTRSYLTNAKPAAGYVMGGFDEGLVTAIFTQPSS